MEPIDDAGRPGAAADDLVTGVTIFTSRYCGYCRRALALLAGKRVTVREIAVDAQPEVRRRMEQLAGARSVPQIFIHGRHVGGCDELYALERDGRLDALLAADAEGPDGRDTPPPSTN